ncbi:hypothetical protein PENTCL1PPCAC_583, partial [Pristionchus entomophagus]
GSGHVFAHPVPPVGCPTETGIRTRTKYAYFVFLFAQGLLVGIRFEYDRRGIGREERRGAGGPSTSEHFLEDNG